MKTLYIHRHAKSDWGDPYLADFDRPLNERGHHDAPLMGRRLKERGESVDLILSSPANRALTTAHYVARSLDYPVVQIVEVKSLYLPSVQNIVRVVNGIDNRYRSAMLFGHNPGFTEVIEYLSGDGPSNLPTAGVACITFEVEQWEAIGFNNGTLRYFDFPKNSEKVGL